MPKLSSVLENSFSEMLDSLKKEYGTIKPEDIKKEKESYTPGITIIGTEKDMGVHRLSVFFVNQDGKRYRETFTDTPYVLNKFKAKIKNIDSFKGQMKAYQNLKNNALGFESEKVGD